MKYGKITDTAVEKVIIPSEFVGDASTEIDGKEIKFEILTTWGKSPIIKCGSKYFTLSWQEILNMAIDAEVHK